MRQPNYHASLLQRIKAAMSNNYDAPKLDALIAEAEHALADEAPDPERLQATLTKLKATRANSRLNAWVVT